MTQVRERIKEEFEIDLLAKMEGHYKMMAEHTVRQTEALTTMATNVGRLADVVERLSRRFPDK